MLKSLHLPLQSQLGGLSMPLAVQLPQGQTLGPSDAPVKLLLSAWSSLARLKTGQVGALAEEFVEGKLNLEGRMRDVMAIVAGLLPGNPVHSDTDWWRNMLGRARALTLHTPQKDAAQVQFHYDVSDAFYALWLDPRRVYSCAYYRLEAMTLAQAQDAKLDHICRSTSHFNHNSAGCQRRWRCSCRRAKHSGQPMRRSSSCCRLGRAWHD